MQSSEYKEGMFAEVLLPLSIPQTYTYGVPMEMQDDIQPGIRVEVPLRNKLYSGLVFELHGRKPERRYRQIQALLDEEPIIQEKQMDFWRWVADYYCAHLGAVMSVALPSGLKLASETRLLLNQTIDYTELELSDDEYLIAEALSIQHELVIGQIQDILNKKTVYPVLKTLLQKKVAIVQEELHHKFKKKKARYVQIAEQYRSDADAAMQLVERSQLQTRALLSYYSLQRGQTLVSAKAMQDMADVTSTVIRAIEKKGIWSVVERSISRIDTDSQVDATAPSALSTDQERALTEIRSAFDDDRPVVLHGVTGSGKTRVYIELISEVLAAGGQVLYLLPEIALTSQIVHRLRAQISEQLYVYHSQISDPERVEIWHAALMRDRLFVGARSSLFLPFYDLRLIIVDEEHDGSYKQDNPAPRYQGRDAAVYLSRLYGADIILGSATPSLESYHNAQSGKYAYVQMMERYGDAQLPSIEIVDMKRMYKQGQVQEGFSDRMLEAIRETIGEGQQVILFQNRRGYAPVLRCKLCAWTAECPNCDVSLTYHQRATELRCHCCGYRAKHPTHCPHCGHHELMLLGTGTEKVEDILPELIDKVRIERFDHDTTRSKKNQLSLLQRFADREIDVLVGTQMITKGFDFDNIGMVGVLSADSLLSYPDLRATERTFQLLMQVGGRAGRRDQSGRFLIQAFHTDHPVLMEVLHTGYDQFYARELADRGRYVQPPYYHLISVWLRHKDLDLTKQAAIYLYEEMRPTLGSRMTAPFDPPTLRIRGKYQQMITIKHEKSLKVGKQIKTLLRRKVDALRSHKVYKRVQVLIDVDPG